MLPNRAPWLFAALCALPLATLAPACGDDGGDAGSVGDPRCEPIASSCLQRQRGCVIDAETDAPECRACPAGDYPTAPLGECAPLPGKTLRHDFGDQTLGPAEEIGSMCQSWLLDNDTELFVNAVELKNTGYYHHSNWFFVPEDHNNWPTGAWLNCYSEGFDEISAALAGGVLYAQSTQTKFELQKFQEGAVIRIPPHSRVIGATHLLNFTPDEVTTNLQMMLHVLPAEDVQLKLVPAQFIYSDLAIPPLQKSLAGGDCDLDFAHRNIFSTNLEMKIHYVLPHYHALGASFDLSVIGGPRDGESLVHLGAYSTDPYGFIFNPPVDLAGATGLHFECGWNNPRDEVIRWGIGDQEMCEALLFIESDMAFSARVGKTTEVDTVNGLEYHTGDCDVLAFPFDTDKP